MSTKGQAFGLGDIANMYGFAHNPGPWNLLGGFVLEVIDDARRSMAVCGAALETDDAPTAVVLEALDNARNRLERAYAILEKLPEFRTGEEPPIPFVPTEARQ